MTAHAEEATMGPQGASIIRHAPGLVNPRWPLCLEAEARQNGWSDAEIGDGEVPWLPLYDHVGTECFAEPGDCEGGRPVPCDACAEWVHA